MKAKTDASPTPLIDAVNASVSALSKSGDLPDSGHWIVALSGGADSTALLHILHDVARQTGRVLTAVIVNHNLRPEAQSEAQLVAMRARSYGITAEILTISAPPPKAARQEWARKHRYDLICAYARKKGGILWLGHHRDDQAETIAMRLSHGSGLQGLSGIRAVTSINHVMSIRPFLSVPKEVLVAYCRDNAYDFISDPSNHNQAFERVRWRAILDQDPILGTQLYHLGNYARTISESLWCRLDDFWRTAVRADESGLALICDFTSFAELPKPLQLLLLRKILSFTGDGGYPPSAMSVTRLLAAILQQQNATLGGCQLSYKGGQIHVFPEAGRPHQPMIVPAGTDMIYKGRLLVRTNVALVLHPMTQRRLDAYDADNSYRKQLLLKPHPIRLLFPFVHALDDSPITPHIKNMVQKGCFQRLDWPTEQVAIYPLSRIATSLMSYN